MDGWVGGGSTAEQESHQEKPNIIKITLSILHD